MTGRRCLVDETWEKRMKENEEYNWEGRGKKHIFLFAHQCLCSQSSTTDAMKSLQNCSLRAILTHLYPPSI